jgi:hypothetical protein
MEAGAWEDSSSIAEKIEQMRRDDKKGNEHEML